MMRTNRKRVSRLGIRFLPRAHTLILAACLASIPALGATDPAVIGLEGAARREVSIGPGTRKPQRSRKTAARAHNPTLQGLGRAKATAPPEQRQEVAELRERLTHQEELVAAQQQQIARLIEAVENQKHLLEHLARNPSQPSAAQGLDQIASLQPVIPIVTPGAGIDATKVSLAGPPSPEPTGATQEDLQAYTQKVDSLAKSVDEIVRGLGGFKFSGDFRLRSDGQFRTGNSVAAPVQNARGRYRLRFNIDRAWNHQFDFHFTVASGRFDNGLTSDSDFAGFDAKAPIFINETSVGYRPNEHFYVRGGKLSEVFSDDSRFLFKEEIRLNGFQEIAKLPVGSNPLGITNIEFRGGQYVLTNPNLPVLPTVSQCNVKAPATPSANCAYLAAGYLPGSRVGDADLFHQGFVISGSLRPGWHHQLTGDLQLWRNQNQIAMAASQAGFAVVLNPSLGLNLAGPITGTGTATTTPNGMVFTAQHFQIAHLNYHLGFDGPRFRDREMPLNFDLHVSRNLGAGFLRDAGMGILSFGDVQKPGDVRLLYAYGIKDGNSMISEVTDDYLGTLSGVNIRAHEIRFDLGLTKFLAWQNYFYVVNPRRGSDPALHFFVPYPAGANTNYRVQSQVQFKF